MNKFEKKKEKKQGEVNHYPVIKKLVFKKGNSCNAQLNVARCSIFRTMLKSRNREMRFFFSTKILYPPRSNENSILKMNTINACKNCKKFFIAAQGVHLLDEPFTHALDGSNAPFKRKEITKILTIDNGSDNRSTKITTTIIIIKLGHCPESL